MLGAMNPLRHRILCLSVLAIAGLAGCDLRQSSSRPPAALSEEAIATRDAPAERVFQGTLGGAPVHLLLHDCEVFLVEARAGGEVRWTSVLKPEPYPFWTSCERQSMAFDGSALTVRLGRQALGAGGCCATGGSYRSADGRNWKKL